MTDFDISTALEGAARSAELADAAKIGDAAFEAVKKDMKDGNPNINIDFIQRDPVTGEVTFKNPNGESIKLEDWGKYYDFETGDPPNFGEILEKMGFKAEDINTPEVKDLIDKTKEEFNNKWKNYQEMKVRETKANELANKHPVPETPKELSPKVAEKSTNTINETIKGAAKGAGKLGKWVAETAVKLLPYGIGGYVLYNLVKDHQAACNGCWKIEIAKPSNRCKISDFTCNSDARAIKNSDVTFCTGCEAINKTSCDATNFNPCLSDPDDKYYQQCATGVYTSDPTHTKCDANDKSYLGPGSDGANCINKVKPNDPDGCPATDDSSWCSKNCDCAKSDNCGGKYILQCVNFNFWGALSDLTDTPIEDLGKLLGDTAGTILNILKYVAIGIVILISILVVFEIIRFFIYGHQTNNESANVNQTENPGVNIPNEIPVVNNKVAIPAANKVSLVETPTEK